jgi:hypothetical protein
MNRKRAHPEAKNLPAHVLEHLKDAARHATPLYVDEKVASRLTGYSSGYFRKQRLLDSGPPYRKIGRSIRYNIVELFTWIESKAHYPQKTAPGIPPFN